MYTLHEPCCDLVPQGGILLLRSCAHAVLAAGLPYNSLHGAIRISSLVVSLTASRQ
jgi:hypothetical protein